MSAKKISLFLIFLASLVVYFPSFFFKLTYFDDQVAVIANHSFLAKWQSIFTLFQRNTFSVFSSQAPGYYRPLGSLPMVLEAHLFGTDPFGYHLTNFIFHAAAACVFYLVLEKISAKAGKINLFLALAFALHPLMVPAVSWIPGRGESILALFIFLSFYFFLSDSFWLHQLFLLFAFFTKESALVFVPLLALYSYFYRLYDFRRLARYCVTWVGCALIFIFAKQAAVGSFAAGMNMSGVLYAAAKNSYGVLLYLGKVFFPVNLSVLPHPADGNLVFGTLTLIMLLLVIFSLWFYGVKTARPVDLRPIVFGAGWFLVFLTPSFIYPDLKQFPGFLEQRAYLPLAGIILAAQQVILYFGPSLKKYRAILKPAALILLLVFAASSFGRSFDYSGRLVFWTKAVNDAPHSALAHRNLGAMLYLEGEFAQAQNQFAKALALNPDEPMAHNNLGLILMNRGDLTGAQEEYWKELKVNPDFDDVHFNFGLLKYRQKQYAQAKELWLRAVSINPGYRDAWEGLIRLAVEEGNPREAGIYLEQARLSGVDL